MRENSFNLRLLDLVQKQAFQKRLSEQDLKQKQTDIRLFIQESTINEDGGKALLIEILSTNIKDDAVFTKSDDINHEIEDNLSYSGQNVTLS